MIKRTDSEWVSLFKLHQHSGQSAAAFCREKQLCSRYFSLRKKQLGWSTQQDTVKTQPKKKSAFVRAVAGPSESITICSGGVTLKIPSTVDPHWLASVVERLR